MPSFLDFPDPPFFIVGVPRSGTTMLRLMLNAHPRLAIPFESGFIPAIYHRLDRYGDLANKENCRAVLADIAQMHVARLGELVADREAILSQPITCYRELVAAVFAAHAIRKGKARWGDKTPSHIDHMEILATLFPASKIIHVVRDGRDVAVSCRRLGWFPRSIPYLARTWREKTLMARKMGVLLGPRRYTETRFEDLILEPEASLKKVCAFLGEDYAPAMLDFAKTARDEMPARSEDWHAKSMSRPDAAKVYEWKRKLSRADSILYAKHARQALAAFGYEPEKHPMTLSARLKEAYYINFARW